jgi:hypothetical protein
LIHSNNLARQLLRKVVAVVMIATLGTPQNFLLRTIAL